MLLTNLLTLIMVVLIVWKFDVPMEIKMLYDNVIARIVMLLLAIWLLTVNKVAGVVALFLIYELSTRMDSPTTPFRYYTGNDKDRHLSADNQFDITLEEQIVSQLAPVVNELPTGRASFEPTMNSSINMSPL
jgi:hypothetical protein